MRNPKSEYIPGDYWVICDRCGFKYRRSECRLTWDNLLVCRKDWEPRHPQDFVRSKRDNQRVPIPRPDSNNIQISTVLSAGASRDDTSISVGSASHIAEYDSIGVKLDDGTVHWTIVTDVTGTTITLNNGLWGPAASGNDVLLCQITGDTFQSPTAVSASDV